MRNSILISLTLLLSACNFMAPQFHPYHLVKTVPLPGAGGWDYLAVDATARRVYVSHAAQVEVLDTDTGEVVGEIPDTNGIHGIAIAADLGRGFTSNGKSNSVTVFDLNSLEPIAQVKTQKKPDAIVYEPVTHRVFAFNSGSDSATAIDAWTAKSLGTVKLGGGPEFSVPDGRGLVFVNLEDKNELLTIEARSLKIVKRLHLAPGSSPSSIAMDRQNRRIFVGCRNETLLVINADTDQIVAKLPIGEHVDATAFDPVYRLVISSAGDGTLTIIHQDNPDQYHVVQTLETPQGSRTFALDEKTHRLFVPAADFSEPPAKATRANPKRRATVIADSFRVLLYDQ